MSTPAFFTPFTNEIRPVAKMRKPRILIIDDEPGLIRLMTLVLTKGHRYEVHAITDATKALEAVVKLKPDLILLDWIMPHLSLSRSGRIPASAKHRFLSSQPSSYSVIGSRSSPVTPRSPNRSESMNWSKRSRPSSAQPVGRDLPNRGSPTNREKFHRSTVA